MAEPNEPAAVEPAAPVVAAEPVAPVEPATPSSQEAADAAEAAEWDEAADEIFPGLKSTVKKEDKKDEPAKPEEEPKTPEAGAEPVETPEEKAAREAKEAEGDEDASGEDDEPDSSSRDSRVAARETAREKAAVRSDVEKQMFANVPQVLSDGDGDPINSIDDVMRLINPRTGEAFTEEEATSWLPTAQLAFDKSHATIEKQIDAIVEVNIDLKDQADAINDRYGELLKTMPDPDNPKVLFRDTLWKEYEESLEKDPESGIIIKAGTSLERFYERALGPYATMAQKAEEEASAADTSVADAAAAEAAKKAEEEAKAKRRADRSDIFGSGKVDEMDDEEKEWADAATQVFGPRK